MLLAIFYIYSQVFANISLLIDSWTTHTCNFSYELVVLLR